MKRISPAKIFVTYWLFCLLLYAFGPFQWVTYKPLLFWTLNILFLTFFVIGWSFGNKLKVCNSVPWTDSDDDVLICKIGKLIYVNLFYEIVNFFRTYQFSDFDIKGLADKVVYGITNMGESYNSFQDSVEVSSSGVLGGSFVTLFNYIWDIWAFSTLFFSLLYFKKLKLQQKIVTLLTVFIILVFYLSRGTNIGVFRIILIILVLLYLKYAESRRFVFDKYRGRKKTRLVIFTILGGIIAITLFDKIMQSRGGILSWQIGEYNIGGIHINHDSVFFKLLPSNVHQLLVALSGYLSQGFYGMSLSLRVPWKFNWGIGGSMALQNLLGGFFPHISTNTYQVRIEQYGWDSYTQWHTLYCWVANDLTYYGVIVFMLLFGLLFRKAFHDATKLNNPYAKLMIYFMFLMALFLPCNNQISQSTYILFSFVYVFFKWQMTKHGANQCLAFNKVKNHLRTK